MLNVYFYYAQFDENLVKNYVSVEYRRDNFEQIYIFFNIIQPNNVLFRFYLHEHILLRAIGYKLIYRYD